MADSTIEGKWVGENVTFTARGRGRHRKYIAILGEFGEIELCPTLSLWRASWYLPHGVVRSVLRNFYQEALDSLADEAGEMRTLLNRGLLR